MAADFASKPAITVASNGGRTAVVYDPNPGMAASSAGQVHFTLEEDDFVVSQADGTRMVTLPVAEIDHLAVAPADGGGYALVAEVTDGYTRELLAGIPSHHSAAALGRGLEREFALALSPVDEEALTELPATKKGRSIWGIIGTVLVVVIVLIFAGSFLKVFIERPKVESAIDEHMRAMKDQDPERAYSLLASRTKAHFTSLADIENFTRDYRPMLQAYQSVTVSEIELQRAFANDPTLPQGTIAYVGGEIAFTNGRVEPFTATLEKEAGEWRIYGFFIGPPPDEGSP